MATNQSSKQQSVNIQSFFQLMVENNASDMHMTAGAPPGLRVDGEIVHVNFPPLTNETSKELIYQVLTEKQRALFERDLDLDCSFEIKNLCRFRANIFYSKGSVSAAFRVIPSDIPDFKSLNLPEILFELADLPNGLILVTGETGSGKSTTLASMLNYINLNTKKHIITIEDPIEFVYKTAGGSVNQREVGRDTKDFHRAIKSLLRQDPDIVLIGELRDPETIESALTIAETGHLTFGTLHTNSCIESLTRIINAFDSEKQEMIRTLLSFTLKGVVSQQLIPKSFESGRIAALELMIPNSGIKNLIRENKVHQIYSQMQMGQKTTGMVTMNQALENLVVGKILSKDDAIGRSSLPAELEKKLATLKDTGR